MSAPVLVTGGTGFVGGHIVRHLVGAGHRVTCVIRAGSADRLPAGVARVIEVADLFDCPPGFWADALGDAPRVIHAAWTATPGRYLHDPANLHCLMGTLSLARGAIAAGVPKLTGIGTCIEYAMGDAPLSTDTALAPSSPYAGAKAAAFLALSTAFAQARIDFAWCRLFYLHGPGEHPARLVASLHANLAQGRPVALSHGHQIRDFLAVEEGARRIVAVALGAVSGPVNICSGTGISVRDLALSIAARYGRPDLLHFGARPDNPVDPPHLVGIPTPLDEGSGR